MIRRIPLILSLVLTGCAATYPALPPPPSQPEIEVDNPTCVSCGWILEEPSLGQTLSQAETGNANAAFSLSLHYSSMEDQQKQTYWQRRAAELGHPAAQYNQWFDLRDSSTCADRLAALAWLEKSAAQGFAEARNKLEDFRKEAENCSAASDASRPAA